MTRKLSDEDAELLRRLKEMMKANTGDEDEPRRTVTVVYRPERGTGIVPEFDGRILKCAGRANSGSGFDVRANEREMFFDCDSDGEVRALAARLREGLDPSAFMVRSSVE